MAQDLKQKKKKWYAVVAPSMFDNALIGETLVTEPELVVGRKLTTNLSNLTENIKHQSLNLQFKVTGVKDNNIETEVVSLEVSHSSIKRLVRKNTNRIDMSFTAETSDKKKVRIKPFLLTRYKTKGRILKILSDELQKSIVEEIGKLTYEDLVKSLVSHNLQRDIRTRLKKVYPIKALEIKRLELEEEASAEKKGAKKKAKMEAGKEPEKEPKESEETAEKEAKEGTEAEIQGEEKKLAEEKGIEPKEKEPKEAQEKEKEEAKKGAKEKDKKQKEKKEQKEQKEQAKQKKNSKAKQPKKEQA